jgi:hypothetical protein
MATYQKAIFMVKLHPKSNLQEFDKPLYYQSANFNDEN